MNPWKTMRMELIQQIADGKSVKQIAKDTGVPKNTIGYHLGALRKEYTAENTFHLIAILIRKKLIQ